VLTVFRYFTIMLCALALAAGLTHVLAVHPDERLVAIATLPQFAAALCALVLTLMSRHRPGFGLALGGTVALVLACLLWTTSTAPEVSAEGLARGIAWWPGGHAMVLGWRTVSRGDLDIAALGIWFVGFSLLVLSAIRQPGVRRPPRGPLPLIKETASRL
jgi:hypothetical protein